MARRKRHRSTESPDVICISDSEEDTRPRGTKILKPMISGVGENRGYREGSHISISSGEDLDVVPTISPDTVDQESPEKQISLSPESIVEPDGPSASTSDQKMNTELRTEKSSASTSNISEKTNTKKKIGRRVRCKKGAHNQCANCAKPNCDTCIYCQDRSGPKKLRKACKNRGPCLYWSTRPSIDQLDAPSLTPTSSSSTQPEYQPAPNQAGPLSSGDEQPFISSDSHANSIQTGGNEQPVIVSSGSTSNDQPQVLEAGLPNSGEETVTLVDEATYLLENCGSQEVTLFVTKCGIFGPAGSGKTTLRHLFLGKDCPVTHESTDILADVDLFSPGLDPVEHLVNVPNASGKPWVEIKDQKMLHLIANTMCVKSPISSSIEESEANRFSIANFKVIKQLKQHLQKKIESSKKGTRRKEKETLNKIKLIHLVDSGGQPQFLEVLPMFARNSSAHLLVHPLNQELDIIPPFKYRINQQSYSVEQDMLLSYEENITHCVQSISSSRYQQGVQNSRYELPKKPHIAIVGMFKDKIKPTLENSLETRNARVSQCLSSSKCLETVNFELILPSRDPKKPVFAFDGSESGWNCEENARDLNKLQLSIADDGRMISVKLPLNWFIFFEAIKEDTNQKDKYFLTIEECKIIAQAREIRMSTTDADEAIQLFDELNLILYFSSILPTIVFTKPAFLYRKVTLLIAESFTNMDRLVDLHPLSRKRFHDTGVFSLDLINNCPDFSTGFCEKFQVNDFLKLLQKLCIISKIKENTFFMPCVLPLAKKEENTPSPEDLPPLYVSFGDKVSPRGLFCAVISSLVAKPMFEVDTTHPLKRNSIELTVYEPNDYIHEAAGSMLLWDKMTHFEVYCFGCTGVLLPVVRKCLASAIYEAATIMHYDFGNVRFSFGLRCMFCDESENHGTSVSKKNNEWYSKCLKNTRRRLQPLEHGDQGLLWFYERSMDNLGTDLLPPTTHQLMEDVALQTNKWKEIALCLLFDFIAIERIEIENPANISNCFLQMFTQWGKQAPQLMPYLWRSIIDVLDSPIVSENTLAQTLKEKYLHH